MRITKLAVCIADIDYQKRFVNCLRKHYKGKLELYLYTDPINLQQDTTSRYEVIVLSGYPEEVKEFTKKRESAIVYLFDAEEETWEKQEEGVHFVEMYQEVNRIVDEILACIGEEVLSWQEHGTLFGKCKIYGVYSLTENQFQIPFAVTLGSILGEKERVLLVDFQENSGLRQMLGDVATRENFGLEDLLIMAEKESYNPVRMLGGIAHLEHMDAVYPLRNTETLCDTSVDTFFRLIKILEQELQYDVLILNFGMRFKGFLETLNLCEQIFLMRKNGGIAQWREYEFFEELEERKGELRNKIQAIEIPIMTTAMTSCERLVEQWKWNEIGDIIRHTPLRAAING